MATIDRPHRLGFAGIPALVAGLLTVVVCAVAGAEPSPWTWLAAAVGGAWGYSYSRRWSTTAQR